MIDKMGGAPETEMKEDDLIVDLERVEEGIPEPGEDEVEDQPYHDPNLEVSSLPDEVEEENAEGAGREDEPTRARVSAPEAPAQRDDDVYARAQAAEQRVRHVEANAIMREAQAHAAVAEQQAHTAKVALDTLALRLDAAYAALTQARDEGDTKTEVEITRAIGEMTQLKAQIEHQRGQIQDPRAIMHHAQQRAHGVMNAPTPGKKVGAGIQARHPLAEQFAASNPWMQSNKQANQFVISQSVDLTRTGWDPNSPGFYRELQRRVQQAYPNLKVSSLQAPKKAPRAGAVRGGVAPASSSSGIRNTAGRGATTGSRYTLTAADQSAMRRSNLDPRNPTHAKYFAKARIESSRKT
jgi:hypothetical protein